MPSPLIQIINSVQLPASAAALYTSPLLTWTQITALRVVNIDTGAHQITLYLVPSGGSATAATESTPTITLLPGGTYNGSNEYGQVLNPGDAIWGLCDTAAQCNIFASGLMLT